LDSCTMKCFFSSFVVFLEDRPGFAIIKSKIMLL